MIFLFNTRSSKAVVLVPKILEMLGLLSVFGSCGSNTFVEHLIALGAMKETYDQNHIPLSSTDAPL